MNTVRTEAHETQTAAEPLALSLHDLLGRDERAKLDALLDHVHEYGTTAEGALRLAAQLCQASRAAERERCARWLEWYDGAETRRSEAIRKGDHWAPDALLI